MSPYTLRAIEMKVSPSATRWVPPPMGVERLESPVALPRAVLIGVLPLPVSLAMLGLECEESPGCATPGVCVRTGSTFSVALSRAAQLAPLPDGAGGSALTPLSEVGEPELVAATP